MRRPAARPTTPEARGAPPSRARWPAKYSAASNDRKDIPRPAASDALTGSSPARARGQASAAVRR